MLSPTLLNVVYGGLDLTLASGLGSVEAYVPSSPVTSKQIQLVGVVAVCREPSHDGIDILRVSSFREDRSVRLTNATVRRCQHFFHLGVPRHRWRRRLPLHDVRDHHDKADVAPNVGADGQLTMLASFAAFSFDCTMAGSDSCKYVPNAHMAVP